MNKKVLTLCAGFLLAGSASAFAQTFAEVTKDDAHKNKVYHVFVKGGENADPTVSELLTEKQSNGNFTIAQTGNLEKKEYMWSISIEPAANGQPTRYNLVNAKSGNSFAIKVGNDTFRGFVDPKGEANDDELWFTAPVKTEDTTSPWIGFKGTDAATTDQTTEVFNYKLVEVSPEEVDEDLNDLYNSIGFNFEFTSDAANKAVENIFNNGTRIKAIHFEDNITVEGDYKFPAGTYFVTNTPKGAFPENNNNNAQRDYLMGCTFVVISPVTNEHNVAETIKTGYGFHMTTIEAKSQKMNLYTGTEEAKKAHGEDISVYNACFKVEKDVNGNYSIEAPKFYIQEVVGEGKYTETTAQVDKTGSLDLTGKTGDEHEDLWLTSSNKTDGEFIFKYKDAATVSALDFLNEGSMAAWNVQLVGGNDIDGKYLYVPANESNNEIYAKGAKFVNPNVPEAQFVVTDVNEETNEITFANRANRSFTVTTKLYVEADGVYSMALTESQREYVIDVINVDENGDLSNVVAPGIEREVPVHGQWVKITPATVDKFAGAWDVDNLTEVTMMFARDNEPSSNKLYVTRKDETGNDLVVTNTLGNALQFQLVKDATPTYRTAKYAYKVGKKVEYKALGDTVAYYTYSLQAYRDGQPQDLYLTWNSGKYGLSDNADYKFIIKDNYDAESSVSIIAATDNYDSNKYLVVDEWTKTSNKIDEFVGKEIKEGDLTQMMKANYVKTYLELSSPEVSLDPKSTYVTMSTELDDYVAIKDDRDGIITGDETTLRLFATDTDRKVPSFLIATGWDKENGERMFLFNSVDSVNYKVATGEFNKEYALNGDHNLNKAIFRPGTLNEANAANDTLFTTIKGKETAVTNNADDNKNVQAGLNRYKFQVVEDTDNEGYYIVRQEGYYLFNVNGFLVFANTDQYNRTNALRVKVAETENPTANESINAEAGEVSVVATNGAVVVKGAEGKNVVVSTILGKVVANEVLTSDNATITVPAGIVVVSVDGEAFKVAVK